MILAFFDRDGARRPAWPRRALGALGLLGLFVLAMSRAAHADTPPDCAADAGQAVLRVSVSGMRSAKGTVTVTIYPDDTAHFLDGKYKVARQELPVTLPITSACFVLAAPANYGVALFHDENGNHHFDTNALGIPVEGYGFSNDPTLYFGPPSLDKVRIAVHAGENPVAIRMKYY